MLMQNSKKSIGPIILISTLLLIFCSVTCTLDKGRKEQNTRAGFKDSGKGTLKIYIFNSFTAFV